MALTPSGAITVALPPPAGTSFSAPPPSIRYRVEESADHWPLSAGAPPSEVSCFSPSAFGGVARGEGWGAGVAGGFVTNVIVCAEASFLPEAVFALGPMVTWYWVFGARLPLVGCTASVFADHAKVTVVAGVTCTAASVDGWSMGWLKDTRIGC